MLKLINGLVDFQRHVLPAYRSTFHRLAIDQAPDCLFVACSDSRVVPNLFASSNPGDLFVIRNVGNLIPPCGCDGALASDRSEAAAIEFALKELKVRDVVVCGHSECGAMRAVASKSATGHDNLDGWLDHARPALERLEKGEGKKLNPNLKEVDRLSQLNVIEQLEHLRTYPPVKRRLEDGSLRLHGWWFEISHALVHAWKPNEGRFVPIDEAEGHKLLVELGEIEEG